MTDNPTASTDQARESLRHAEERFRSIIENVRDYAIFVLDARGFVATWNLGAERIKGYARNEIIGQHFSRFYDAKDVADGKCERELEVAVADGRFEEEAWRYRKDGSRFWANVVITPLKDETTGTLLGFAKVTRDLTERRRVEAERLQFAQTEAARLEAENSVRTLVGLQLLTGALAAASTPHELARLVIERGIETLGAFSGSVVRPRTMASTSTSSQQTAIELDTIATLGLDAAVIAPFARFSTEGALPPALAFRTRQPVWIEDATSYVTQFPDAPAVPTGALCSLPLITSESTKGVSGVLTFRFETPRSFSSVERAFMETFASQAAQAFERADIYAREILAKGRLQALGDLAAALSSALTTEDVATVIVDLGKSGASADVCTLYLLNQKETALELIAEKGCNPSILDRIRSIAAGSNNPIWDTLAAHRSVWAESPEDYARIYPRLAHADVSGERAQSFWSIPLVAEGKTIGLLGMGFYASRTFSDEERAFVTTLTRHCAEALLRAHRLDAERLAREAERQARLAADVANRAKDEFLATVSHELRTPLNAIMGWAKMLTSTALDEERRVRAIDTIDRNAVAMAQLIEDLLDISRIISGKMRLEVQSVDLARVIEAAIDSVKPAADAKDIRILALLDSSVHTTQSLMGDPTRLQQIVWNLLSNAVKFTPKGGKINVVLEREQSGVRVCVTDTGRGIDPDFLPHVFDPFRQEDASHTRSRGGLGLGLAITRQLVELHGGHIEARSDGTGRGATFIVILPITAVSAASSSSPERETGRRRRVRLESTFERPAQLRGLRALVVDDEEDARELVKAVLEECGCQVVLAADVALAMSIIIAAASSTSDGGTPFDVLISDIGMPGQDGFDLIKQVRALPITNPAATIPAAALTAYARAEDRRRVLNAGYSMHIAKPIEPAELVAVVMSLTRFVQRPPPSSRTPQIPQS